MYISQKVTDLLDMRPTDDTEVIDPSKILAPIELIRVDDSEIIACDNPEIPNIMLEMRRIEEGLRQNDELLKIATAATMHALATISLSTPQYQARAIESSASLFSAVADLNKFKIDSQIRLVELKLKLDSYTRIKPVSRAGDINTIMFTGSTVEALRALKKVSDEVPAENQGTNVDEDNR